MRKKEYRFRVGVLMFCLVLSAICPVDASQLNNDGQDSPIDFSCVGYGGGGENLPWVDAVLYVQPTGGDDTWLLQSAINQIGNLPINKDGFRGALQLSGGQFHISGQLHISKSGIVVRGNNGNKKTVLLATGNSRRTLVEIHPDQKSILGGSLQITDAVVQAGGNVFTLSSLEGLAVDVIKL